MLKCHPVAWTNARIRICVSQVHDVDEVKHRLTILVAKLLLSPTVKEFLKSADASQSYERISSGTFLWLTVYISN